MSLSRDLLANWGVSFATDRPDLAIAGSPERCISRRVIEDDRGGLWLLERIAAGQAARREGIGRLLAGLRDSGLWGLSAYLPGPGGRYVVTDWGGLWQLSPFISGRPLDRPRYLEKAGLGSALGGWLAALGSAGRTTAAPAGLRDLDLPAFVAELMDTLSRRNPEVRTRAARALPALSGLFEAWADLPRELAHGDLHPVNVIWSESGVAAVIDWEFAGPLPAGYDLANCLGCAGIEGDGGFDSPFSRALVATALDNCALPEAATEWLAPMILAGRFGWLSEWLRRGDAEMIGLELAYLDHLACSTGRDRARP